MVFSLCESEWIRFQPQSTVNSSLTARALGPAHMEEGGVHHSSYITWLFHHLVAVLCNDANGEKEGGEKFISKSGRSQVSCFCRGSQCTSLLLPYERRSVWFTLKLWRFSPRPDRGEALVKLARPEYCLRGTVDAFPFFPPPEILKVNLLLVVRGCRDRQRPLRFHSPILQHLGFISPSVRFPTAIRVTA